MQFRAAQLIFCEFGFLAAGFFREVTLRVDDCGAVPPETGEAALAFALWTASTLAL